MAGLAGLLAGLTHVTIVALVVMLALQLGQALRASRVVERALLGVAALPLLGAALFLIWRDFMGFRSITAMQTQSWDRFIAFLMTTLWVLGDGLFRSVPEQLWCSFSIPPCWVCRWR